MKSTTLVIFLGSLGFLLMGIVSLTSKKINSYFKESGVYNNIDKFMKYNGIFNLSIGIIGSILGVLDILLEEKSQYIIVIYILITLTLSIIQNKILKKYRNI